MLDRGYSGWSYREDESVAVAYQLASYNCQPRIDERLGTGFE